MNKEQLDLLKRVGRYVDPQPYVNLIYHTPAQGMRNAADQIEAKEKDMREFWALIKELENN